MGSLLLFGALVQILLSAADGAACRGISGDVPCQCDRYGRCMKGTVDIDPWLQFALKTQRELQIDLPLDRIQIFDAHNAFNARAYGLAYGANDTCLWPPPYDNVCLGLANHEFDIVDMLQMGVRGFEVDNWWCADAMRLAHLGLPFAIGCGEFNVLYADVIADIGAWLDEPGNEDEFVRIYINEKFDQGHDAEMNGPLERFLGHDRILSPADFRTSYGGVWPTLRRMREDGKRVVVVTNTNRTHQGKYIHEKKCRETGANKFTGYPQCAGKQPTDCLRVLGDATHYVFDVIYDGPTSSGVITDLTEHVKCAVNFPSTDMVHPQLMETAVFTWAKGEPSLELQENSCVMLSHEDHRWHTSSNCNLPLSYACQSSSDPEEWIISETTGAYDVTGNFCPIGYEFSVPHNGYRQQKLIEAMQDAPVWINFSPWLTGQFPTARPPASTPRSHAGSLHAPPITWLLAFMALSFIVRSLAG
ncbi:uncharacterized protein MT2135-like [Diadema antillarum]